MADINWTAEQRAKIDEAIAAETESSRLAHKLIPEYKLSPSDRAVPADSYDYTNDTIEEFPIKLEEIEKKFSLTKLQVEDQDLSGALMKTRRAAQQLAIDHDVLVFNKKIRDRIQSDQTKKGVHTLVNINSPYPDGLVPAVAAAVAALDGAGHRTGFVMVAGHDVYTYLYTRANGSADLPIKAVQGLLEGGPIHRSAVLATDEALILSLSGEEIDRAVAVSPTLEFLGIDANQNREFRLYERFLPRYRQTDSVVLLKLGPAAKRAPTA